MKQMIIILIATLVAVTGCQSNTEVVTKKEAPVEVTVKEALKSFKTGKVEEVVEHEGQVTVVIKGDEDQGARGHSLDTVNQAKKFMKKVTEKPERLTVGLMYEDQRLLQFSLTKDGETLEKAHPEIEEYLENAGHFK